MNRIFVAFIIGWAIVGCPDSASSATRTEHVVVTAYAPLQETILGLEKKYGWLITYQSPHYRFRGELLDLTPFNSKHPAETYKNGFADLVPLERTIDFEYEVDSATRMPIEPPEAILTKAIESYSSVSGYEFAVKREDGRFYVIPTIGKDEEGRRVPETTLLDAPVSFPAKDRTLHETMRAICEAWSSATLIKFTASAEISPNLLMGKHLTMGASGQPVKEVFSTLFLNIDPRLSYQVTHFIGSSKLWYLVYIHRVPDLADQSTKPSGVRTPPKIPSGSPGVANGSKSPPHD